MGAHFPVVLVDDGELDEVREILLELGVEFAHLRGGAVPSRLEPPRELFIATVRHAGLARSWPLGSDERPVRIAVAAEDSTSARNALRKMGFSYLVRRPVHPVAFRLLLLRALYRGEERRREPRVPVGFDVSVRSGLRRREALLVDLSSRGCRLLTDRAVAERSKLTLHLPEKLAGNDTLALSGRVVRCVADRSSPLDGCYSVAVEFAPLAEGDRERLEHALAAHAQSLGPPPPEQIEEPRKRRAARATRTASTRAPGIEPVHEKAPAATAPPPERTAPPPAAPRQTPRDRRRFQRVHYERRVIAAAEAAMHRMLIGHDLSVGGMRVERHPELQVGQRLRIALYDAARETPVVVEAVVARDDGPHGMALHFEQIDDEIATRLEDLVASLPPVECLGDGESGALGTVVSEIIST